MKVVSLETVTMIEITPVISSSSAGAVVPHDSEWVWSHVTAESDVHFFFFLHISVVVASTILALRVEFD